MEVVYSIDRLLMTSFVNLILDHQIYLGPTLGIWIATDADVTDKEEFLLKTSDSLSSESKL